MSDTNLTVDKLREINAQLKLTPSANVILCSDAKKHEIIKQCNSIEPLPLFGLIVIPSKEIPDDYPKVFMFIKEEDAIFFEQVLLSMRLEKVNFKKAVAVASKLTRWRAENDENIFRLSL